MTVDLPVPAALLIALGLAGSLLLLTWLGRLVRFVLAIAAILVCAYVLIDLEGDQGTLVDRWATRWGTPSQASASVARVGRQVQQQVRACLDLAATADTRLAPLTPDLIDKHYALLLSLERDCIRDVVMAYARHAPELANAVGHIAHQMRISVPAELRDQPYDPSITDRF